MDPVNLELVAGLPYSRSFRVTNGISVWPTREAFEVRSQIRVGKTVDSELLGALTPYITAIYDNLDIVVTVSLTGAQTRAVPAGFYDIILSDTGTTDARAIRIATGSVKVKGLVTAATDV